MKKVALIGSIGYGESTSSGQVIRTRILLNALEEHYGKEKVYLINTSDYRHHAMKIVFRTIVSLFECKTYIVILSGNGRKVFFPVLILYKNLFGKRVLNNIIGGDYAESVRKYPRYIKYSNAFDVNWVQMPSMKKEVEDEGIINVEVLPNSKPLKIVMKEELRSGSEKPFRFCTFSRVSKEKGIETAIRAIEQINQETGERIVELTIYGKPDDDYKERFDSVLASVTDAIHYGGVISFDKTSEVLQDYFMLLFPTTFYGEGFPGTILDAYASALPVIASDWKFNPELIKEGETGYIYDHTNFDQFVECLKKSIANPKAVDSMRENCVLEAKKYVPETVMPIVFSRIEESWGV